MNDDSDLDGDRAVRLLDIQSRVRTATGPNDDLDMIIWVEFCNRTWGARADCTSSIDAALALVERVLPPMNVVVNLRGQPRCQIVLSACITKSFNSSIEASAPLAILDALLSALIAETQGASAPANSSLIAETSEPKVVEHG